MGSDIRIDRSGRRQFLRMTGAVLGSATVGANSRTTCLSPPLLPDGIPLSLTNHRNWSFDVDVPLLWIAKPRTAGDVVRLANWAKDHGYVLRARGMSHNWSPIVVTNGTDVCVDRVLLVDTTGLAGVTSFKFRNGRPIVGFRAGTTVEAATAFLETMNNHGVSPAPGYTFQNMTAPGQLTLGGVLAIGGHGCGVPSSTPEPDLNGCLSNLISSVTAVVTDPGGRYDEYTLRKFDRAEAPAAAFLVHLGRAFITEVELQVIPNFYLQVASRYPTVDTLFCPPSTSLPADALASLLDEFGRVEVIWFCYTNQAWVKTWELKSHRIFPQVSGPYNYPWANSIDPFANGTLHWLLRGNPALAPSFGELQLGIAKHFSPEGSTMNGTARDLLLFVKASTMRVTAFAYAIQMRRRDVQSAVNIWYELYRDLVERYRSNGKYPWNSAVELRFTTTDMNSDLAVHRASAPALSACRSVNPFDPTLDTVMWISVLTVVGTPDSNQFFAELEERMAAVWARPGINVMRPEWAKGWAYTADGGPWTNTAILTQQIPSHYNQPIPTFDHARQTLAAYDRFNIYTNSFLDTLLPG
jgi:hypothetical protein